MPPVTRHLAVVGAGPRGLSVLERLCANERRGPSADGVIVHLVDPHLPGAGAVWRPDQPGELLTNTVASQITVFTDDSVRIEGPIEPGPSLYEWAQSLALLGGDGDYDERTLAEARRLGPDSYPSRGFYGHYLHDCYRRIVSRAPAHIEVREHRTRAVVLSDALGAADGPQSLRLENGARLDGLDAVLLAVGHVGTHLTARQRRTADLALIHGLTYVTPANPADVDLSWVEPQQNVLLRGLGLNFFDYMALLTTGRGGRFVRERDRLVYRASGLEPRLYAFSRRGVPYHARGENEKGAFGRYYPRLLTAEYVARLRARAAAGERIGFTEHLWPLIKREVESVYYATTLRSRGVASDVVEGFTDRYLDLDLDLAEGAGSDELLSAHGLVAADRFDWDRLTDPCGDLGFASRDEYRDWLLGYLRADAEAGRAGNLSGPLKASLDILRDLRNEIRLAVDHGGLDGESHRDELERWYTPLNAFLSIGPPVTRIEEMAALIEAGVLTVTGPGTEVRLDSAEPAFIAASTRVPGRSVHATALIEARLPEPDVRRTEDPLLRHLLETEQAVPYRITTAQGTEVETGGLAVTERPYRIVDRRGRAHPRRFAYGVPTESVHWVTAAGVRPGVDSVTLGDSDAIARALVSLPRPDLTRTDSPRPDSARPDLPRAVPGAAPVSQDRTEVPSAAAESGVVREVIV
ncbi:MULTISPECIES: FAD/NAD(P)-binding domain-containing protein [unclassified Streptomyces]|uniref:FAD/NAD(P)-binding protein n=1 Tax=unclassified Streptomyces TaxID=2593676 RepID=UPI000C280F8A|nr:FAD/NAD(P)-binding protein [Streptomyces sp. CB01201]PJN02286.1 FAD-binding protein [Streptomyces sp. CB01201]